MPTKSDIVSFNGTTLASIGVTGQINFSSGIPTVDPGYEERRDAPAAYQSATRPTTDLEAVFLTETYGEQAAVLAMLDFPRNRRARTLVVNGGDYGSPTQVQTNATVVSVDVQAGSVVAIFRTGDVVWRAVSPITEGLTSFNAAGSTTFTVAGEVTTTPLIKVGWSAPRSSSVADVGWKYRRKITVTNNSSQALHNYPLQLGPLDTAALTAASKMRSNGWDFDVFNEKGERLNTAVIAPNTKASFIWFVVDELAAGGSRTYDVCYGNPAANASGGFPYYKSYTPAIDIFGENGTATGAGTGSNAPTGLTTTADQWVGSAFLVTEGAGIGQYRTIASHTTGGSTVFTFTRGLTSALDATSKYVIVGAGVMVDGGNVSGIAGQVITDGAQAWETNQWIGAKFESYNAGTGAVIATGTVTANTATTLTIDAFVGTTPTTSTKFRLIKRNGKWIWRTNQINRANGPRGRWRLNRGQTKPSNMWFAVDGTPAAWSVTTYNPGQASYDYNQLRVTATDIGGGVKHYFSVLNASVARKDGARFREEGYGNGCEINIPLGVLGIRHDFQIKNPSAMAKAVFGCREQGGQDWEIYWEYPTAQASLTTVSAAYYDLTAYGTPLHLLAALTSDDDADIADDETGTANLQDGSVLEVSIDTRSLAVTDLATASEENVYDMSLTIRRGGSSEATGDDLIRIGGSTRHVFLTSTQKLWIGDDGIVPLGFRIYDGSTFVRDVPNGVQVLHTDRDTAGTVTRFASSDLLPLPPGSQTLRVSDQDGNIGTVTVETTYAARYL